MTKKATKNRLKNRRRNLQRNLQKNASLSSSGKGFPSCSYYNPTNMNHAGPRLPSEPRHYERQANADLGLYDHIKIKTRKRRNASQSISQSDIMVEQWNLVVRLPPNGTEKHVEHGFGRRNNELIQLIRNRQELLQEKKW